jgi:ribose/xylose/arabinose/galactoside ABC-type transport system permease subunit
MSTTSETTLARIGSATERLRERREFSVLFGLAAIWLLGIVISPAEFLSLDRFNRLFRSAARTAVVGYGIALLMITAEFDLSVGSLFALSGAMGVLLVGQETAQLGVPPEFAIVLILLFGFIYGVSQGLMVTKLELPSLIVTIGTLTLVRGALRLFTGGVTLSTDNDYAGYIDFFGQGIELATLPLIGEGEPLSLMSTVDGQTGLEYQIPFVHSDPQLWTTFSAQIIWMIVFLGLFHYVLFGTKFGHHVRATGDNVSSVETTGIDPELIKIGCFGIASTMAAFASLMFLGRSMGVSATTGSGLELTVIAAVVLGGTKLTGGEGTMVGTALGAIVFASANSVLNLANLGISGWRGIITGGFIIAAIGLDAVFEKVSVAGVRSAYLVPTREILTSPTGFFREKSPRKTTDDMFAYLLTSIFVTGIVFLVADTILTLGSVESALGIDTSSWLLFLQGGFPSVFVQMFFFVFLLGLLALVAIQASLRALGSRGEYGKNIGIVAYATLPAPLLTIPVLLYGYDFEIFLAGDPLTTGVVVLAPILLLMLGIMYAGVRQVYELPRGEAVGAVFGVVVAWIAALAYMLTTVAGIS